MRQAYDATGPNHAVVLQATEEGGGSTSYSSKVDNPCELRDSKYVPLGNPLEILGNYTCSAEEMATCRPAQKNLLRIVESNE